MIYILMLPISHSLKFTFYINDNAKILQILGPRFTFLIINPNFKYYYYYYYSNLCYYYCYFCCCLCIRSLKHFDVKLNFF